MSFNEWKKCKLGDVLNFRRGHDLPKKDMIDGMYPVVGSNGVIGYHNTFTTKSPCLTIGRSGNIGIPHILKQECWAHNTTLYIDDFKGNDPEFIYYLLKNINLAHYGGGSAVPTLNRNHIHPIDINFPDNYDEQKSIAAILSTLDEKIETNNQINKKLEEMAQAIFKQWFVDFEFPNENGGLYKSSGGEMVESEMGMIPKGWEVAKIGEVAKIIRGASPRPIQDFMSDKGMPWLKISDATSSQGKYIVKIKEFIKEEGITKSRIVTQGTLVLSNSATPGLAKIMLVEACAHDGWLIFSDYKKVSKEFMYYLVKEREGILSLSNGSVFRNLKTDILKNYPIIIPNEEVIKKVNSIYVSINEDIKKRTLENGKLETIKDALLPKLMLGEIRVPINN